MGEVWGACPTAACPGELHRSDPDQGTSGPSLHTDLEPPSSPLGPSYSFWAGQMGRVNHTQAPLWAHR